MRGTPAIYLGRIVDKASFRAVVYGADGSRKLVKSWDEFELAMQSGIWFAKKDDATVNPAVHTMTIDEIPRQDHAKPAGKPKPNKPNQKSKEPPQRAQRIPDDGMGFEVKDE